MWLENQKQKVENHFELEKFRQKNYKSYILTECMEQFYDIRFIKNLKLINT